MMEKQKYPNIYIFNKAGCHGHFLTYLIDRLSDKTPKIEKLPFNGLGNSHNEVVYSGFVETVTEKDFDKTHLSNQNIVKLIQAQNILYYERVALNRAEDANRDIHTINKDISFLKEYNLEFYHKIKNLYSIEKDKIPKWLLRDAYKLGFLDLATQGSVIQDMKQINYMKEKYGKNNNIHYSPVNIFFSYESLKEELATLDKKFSIGLDFKDLKMLYEEFVKRNKILQTHRNTDTVLKAVRDNQDVPVPTLDIIQEAYVYAELEKEYDFVTMPMTDYFFTTTGEILDFVNLYPQHYKAMNPNLPKFNNIDNPFFLHRQINKSML